MENVLNSLIWFQSTTASDFFLITHTSFCVKYDLDRKCQYIIMCLLKFKWHEAGSWNKAASKQSVRTCSTLSPLALNCCNNCWFWTFSSSNLDCTPCNNNKHNLIAKDPNQCVHSTWVLLICPIRTVPVKSADRERNLNMGGGVFMARMKGVKSFEMHDWVKKIFQSVLPPHIFNWNSP